MQLLLHDAAGMDGSRSTSGKKAAKDRARELRRNFDEVEHGALIAAKLNLDHVLSNPATCCYLRSLFGWCVRQLMSVA